MERIRKLNSYGKAVLAIMLVMTAVFGVLYAKTLTKNGFRYRDTILEPGTEDGNRIYSGTLKGKPVKFTVQADHSLIFACGETIYGPYTIVNDPSAVPEEIQIPMGVTGIEVYCKDERIFRGGILKNPDGSMMGTLPYLFFSSSEDPGLIVVDTEWDEDGTVIEVEEPDVVTVLEVLNGPVLGHKGSLYGFAAGLFLCLVNAASILFADELFRWQISFRVRDPEAAVPSEWEMTSRYLSWGILTGMIFVIFMVGLK